MPNAIIGILVGSEKYDFQHIQRVKRGTDKVKDAVSKLKAQGFKKDPTNGSHTIFAHGDGRSMSIPNANASGNQKLSPNVHNQIQNVLNGHGREDLLKAVLQDVEGLQKLLHFIKC